MLMSYTPNEWFWVVGGNESQWYSSEAGAYVAPDSLAAQAFTNRGGLPSRILNEVELDEVLRLAGLPGLFITRADIDAEATRRTRAGFIFGGKHYQFDELAKGRITGAAALAHQAITVGGKQATDTKWHNSGGADDPEFAWIATDNSLNVMDAATVLALGKAAANWESRHVFAAKALKDTDPIPADYTDDAFWP